MGKMKGVTAGKCEVCGAKTDIESPKVCYGCVMKAKAGVKVKETTKVATSKAPF